MATYSISEKRALKKLKIPDFRYMTKDKIVQFMSMVPHMDPTVAKAAIDQFPEFKDLAIQMTNALKEMVDKAFKSEKESQDYFYDECSKMLDTLREQLKDENIDANERQEIRDNMMQIIFWIGQKDNDHKKFVRDSIVAIAGSIVAIVGTGAALLGGVISLPSDNSEDNGEGFDV